MASHLLWKGRSGNKTPPRRVTTFSSKGPHCLYLESMGYKVTAAQLCLYSLMHFAFIEDTLKKYSHGCIANKTLLTKTGNGMDLAHGLGFAGLCAEQNMA